MHRFILISALVLLGLTCSAGARPLIVIYNYTAPAPAFVLASTNPQDNQQFTAPPPNVEFTFSQTILKDKSSVQLFDPYDNLIASSMTMPGDSRMSIAIPSNLLNGTYRVDWSATCACQAATVLNGSLRFVVTQ